uniref:Uncharacterized protein n=1 Tax=Parascaris univalens TaxID=6257 RepID=A0A915BNG7_PARUN
NHSLYCINSSSFSHSSNITSIMYRLITFLCVFVTIEGLVCYMGGSVGNQFPRYFARSCGSSQYCVTITPTLTIGGDFVIKACENVNEESSLPIEIPISVNAKCKAEQCYRTTARIFNTTTLVNMCCCGDYLCNCSPNALDMDRCPNATLNDNDGGGTGAASSNNNLFLLVMIIVFILFGLHEI